LLPASKILPNATLDFLSFEGVGGAANKSGPRPRCYQRRLLVVVPM
jgi:hypothetical protein